MTQWDGDEDNELISNMTPLSLTWEDVCSIVTDVFRDIERARERERKLSFKPTKHKIVKLQDRKAKPWALCCPCHPRKREIYCYTFAFALRKINTLSCCPKGCPHREP